MSDQRVPGARAGHDRQQWPVRVFHRGDEPGDDLSATTTPQARLAMMWPLAEEAFTLAGRATAAIPRDRLPISRRRAAPIPDRARR